jgi:hypothetical protein
MVDRKHIGRESEPTTVRINAGSVSDFARVIGETDPVYHDINAAKAAGYPNIVAPPTYPIAFMAESMNPDMFFELGLNFATLVHGSQEFVYHRPIIADAEYRIVGRVADAWEKQGKSGLLDFVVMEADAQDMAGNLVYTSRITIISRRAKPGEEELD